MPDKNAVSPTCAKLQRRIVELENHLMLRSGQCAQAVAALIEVARVVVRIEHDPASSPQSVADATGLRLSVTSVIDMLTDEVEGIGDSGVLHEAIEAARRLLASGVPSLTMH